MKKAFTLVELIFVIVLLGILSGAAIMSIPDNTLMNDLNFVRLKIKEKQMDALRYDLYDFNDASWRNNFNDKTCIDTDSIKDDALTSKNARKVKLTSTLSSHKICFDSLGRPYHDNFLLNNFIKQPIVVNIEYKNSIRKLNIMPYSGSIMIER